MGKQAGGLLLAICFFYIVEPVFSLCTQITGLSAGFASEVFKVLFLFCEQISQLTCPVVGGFFYSFSQFCSFFRSYKQPNDCPCCSGANNTQNYLSGGRHNVII